MQRRKIISTLSLGLALMLISSLAMAQYQLTNLVSNQVGSGTAHRPSDRECLGTRLRSRRSILA